MVDSVLYIDWIKKSKSDLRSAEILYKYDGDSAIIAFHCQQAIEKALKAFLLKKDGRLRVGHSLLYLL